MWAYLLLAWDCILLYGEDFVDMKWLSISIADKMVVESYSRSLRLIDAVVSWKCGLEFRQPQEIMH